MPQQYLFWHQRIVLVYLTGRQTDSILINETWTAFALSESAIVRFRNVVRITNTQYMLYVYLKKNTIKCFTKYSILWIVFFLLFFKYFIVTWSRFAKWSRFLIYFENYFIEWYSQMNSQLFTAAWTKGFFGLNIDNRGDRHRSYAWKHTWKSNESIIQIVDVILTFCYYIPYKDKIRLRPVALAVYYYWNILFDFSSFQIVNFFKLCVCELPQ